MAGTVQLAPPFRIPPWTRSVAQPSPNCWHAARLDPATGIIVLQLGTRAPATTPEGQNGFVNALFNQRYVVTAVAGFQTFRARIDPLNLTLRHRGGTATILGGFLAIAGNGRGQGGSAPLVLGTPFEKGATPPDPQPCGAPIQLTVGVSVRFTGVQEAYGEVIARVTWVTYSPPYGPFCS